MRRGNKGFTMVEAVMATFIVALSVVGSMGALAHMTESERVLRDKERMQRLAVQKLDELVSQNLLTGSDVNGDFQDRGETRYKWTAHDTASGTTNIDTVTVTVSPVDDDARPEASVSTIIYRAPVTGST